MGGQTEVRRNCWYCIRFSDPEGAKFPEFKQQYIFETDAKWSVTVNLTDVEDNVAEVTEVKCSFT